MNEKLLAGFVAAVAIAPLCAVCVLGPAVLASVITGVSAWFGSFDAIVTVALVLVAGVVAYEFFRKRRTQRVPAKPAEEISQ